MNKKEIVEISEKDHLRLRPTIYIGSVVPSDEKIPLIKGGKIVMENKIISVGFYKLFNEILDNSIDESKRLKGKMKLITVRINSTTNEISIEDTGEGFYKGIEINKTSGISNIETAVSRLRAGSNFYNDDINESLIGTNGFGSVVVNMLSDEFSIETRNSESYFSKKWIDFEPQKEVVEKKKQKETGTTVKFIPLKKLFKNVKWDKDIMSAMLTFKNFLIKNDPLIKNLKLEVFFDGEPLDIGQNFIPDKSFIANTSIGTLVIYESFENSGSISFVNSAMCSGIHQKIINDKINVELEDSLGHHFYETFIVFNFPPKIVRFGDQNKTKFVSTRDDVENVILDASRPKLKQFFATPLFESIKKKVEARKMDSEIKKLRNMKKKSSIKNSHKYFPPSGRIENLFIVEGESAMGSILQSRNTKTDGVYSLKGKIKNVRSVSDLSGNREIIELMQILDLDTDASKRTFTYKRIIIATDFDPDGGHIFSLLVNFFFKWFPYIIDEGRLFSLKVPLMSVDNGKQRDYFYEKKEFDEYAKKKTIKNLRYLKGLGSLDIKDWEIVMGDIQLLQIKKGDDAKKWMDMAFSQDSGPRKLWLSNKFK